MLAIKVIQSLIMPSTFIFIFIVFGFILLLKKRVWGKRLFVLGIFFYFIFSITPVSDFLLNSLEKSYTPLSAEEIPRANKIVLLLGGRESNVLRGSEVLRIWHLADEEMKVIISGTDPLVPTSEEAQAVRNFFAHRGIKEEDIIIEGRSRNTMENVRNVQKIVGQEPFFLVTSAYHMDRSLSEFRKTGANPLPAPADFKRKIYPTYTFFDFVPNAYSLRNADIAFHEHIGRFYYRIIFLMGG